MKDAEEKEMSLFEQHAQSIAAAATLALLIGAGTLLFNMREDVQVLKIEVQHLNEQIRAGVDDRFRGADWRREERALAERFQSIERRLEKLEQAHEGGVHRLIK